MGYILVWSYELSIGVLHKSRISSSSGDSSSSTTVVSLAEPVKCTMCSQSFGSAAKLFMHQHKYHKNGSSLQCPICFKKFNSQANALVHLRAHTQEKTYECHLCSLAFCDSSTLKKHIRTHTGEKPYECHLCDKKFTQSGNLKRHITVHEKYDAIQAKNFPSVNLHGSTGSTSVPNMSVQHVSDSSVEYSYNQYYLSQLQSAGNSGYGYYQVN